VKRLQGVGTEGENLTEDKGRTKGGQREDKVETLVCK